MSSRGPLAVHLYDTHVADLLDAGFGDTALQYTDAASVDPTRSRLSLSLPVRSAVYPAVGPGGRFVRSLLPEGRALAWAVEEFGIPEDDRYGLIATLGRDVAGAVQVLTGGPQDPGGRYEEVDGDDLARMIARAHDMGLGLDRRRRVRLSLAGMQDKVLLHRAGGSYLLPVDGAPSTLIVKPEPTESARADGLIFDGIATNELFCLTLARTCGLTVSEARVEKFGGTDALVVARYDRETRPDGSVVRVHQEDLLGALGLDPLLKYERPLAERRDPGGGWDQTALVARAGPTLRMLAAVLAEHLGAAHLGAFLDAVAFNIVIGNANAHARNYSVLLPRTGTPLLAPLYDLISTRLWDVLDRDAAQRVAGEDDIDAITVDHLAEEAVSWSLPDRFVRNRIDRLLSRVEEKLEAATVECAFLGGDARVGAQVASLVAHRVDGLRRSPTSR
jgi:serine/threonine-protein kinase HipA